MRASFPATAAAHAANVTGPDLKGLKVGEGRDRLVRHEAKWKKNKKKKHPGGEGGRGMRRIYCNLGPLTRYLWSFMGPTTTMLVFFYLFHLKTLLSVTACVCETAK